MRRRELPLRSWRRCFLTCRNVGVIPRAPTGLGVTWQGGIELAREKLAVFAGADPREILFTSCGTESNNAAIHSALMAQPRKRHVLMTSAEHSSNLQFGKHLLQQGYEVTFLPIEPDGSLDLHLLEKSIRPDTAIVSVMWANNETGVIFPIEEVAAICRSKEVPCHTDAVQVPGKFEIDAEAVGVDFLSLSAHKLYAPKGIGLLYVRQRTKYRPYIIGGHQENGRRGGTENVPYIVGFARAAELAKSHIQDENTRIRSLRDRLEESILRKISGASRNAAKEPRLPNTTNISFAGIEGEALVLALDQVGICVSTGSACTTGSPEPSHVLTAMGIPAQRARGSVRFSLGRYTTLQEVDYVLDQLPKAIAVLRAVSPNRDVPREHQTAPV